MDLALIDDDSLYQAVFKEFFDSVGINIMQFSTGKEFMEYPIEDLVNLNCVVIDHTILDITSANLTKSINNRINAEVCMISTDGRALETKENKGLGISGDFKKLDLKNVLNWYSYFKNEKLLQF